MYPLLYKYCKFSEKNHDIENLKNDTLFFNSPTGYNDPYEGIISVSIVDIFEAFLIVKSEMSPDSSISLEEIETIFTFPKMFDNIGNSEDIQNVRILLFDMLNKALKYTQVSPEVAIYFTLFKDDDFLKLFPYISNATLTISQYNNIVNQALSQNSTLSDYDKNSLLNFYTDRYEEKYKIVNSLRRNTSVVVPIYLMDAIHNTPFKQTTYEETLIACNNLALETFENARQLPGKSFKTTCLSENPTSVLMWAHYANQHTGFCIEYDFNNAIGTSFPLERLAKVNYSSNMTEMKIESLVQIMRKKLSPNFVKDPDITQLTVETCLEAIITKNLAWQYEKEWRIILDNFSGIKIDKIPYVTKIIVGVNIAEKHKQELLKFANEKNPPIPVYQAFLLPNKYEIGYYQIS